jgi:hypothetical protein
MTTHQTLDPEWRDTIELFGADILAAVEALARELTPTQGERLLRILVQVDEATHARTLAEQDHVWHSPRTIRPAWRPPSSWCAPTCRASPPSAATIRAAPPSG